eukprot:439910-Prymnesium_polylepis.2
MVSVCTSDRERKVGCLALAVWFRAQLLAECTNGELLSSVRAGATWCTDGVQHSCTDATVELGCESAANAILWQKFTGERFGQSTTKLVDTPLTAIVWSVIADSDIFLQELPLRMMNALHFADELQVIVTREAACVAAR